MARKSPQPGLKRFLPRNVPIRLSVAGVEILIYREKKGFVRVVAPPEVEIDKGLTSPPPKV